MREMKDSGIEWVGKIPSNWMFVRIGSLYGLRVEKVSDRDYQPLSVTKLGILPQLETAAKTNAHDDRKLVKIGDFAINSRSDRRGSCGISGYEGSVSLINTVLYPIADMNPQYYNWLFHTTEFADEFYRWGHGIVDDLWTTGWQDMKNIVIIQPSIEEQQRIAVFLDTQCTEIDALVSDIQAQIDTLEQYKRSVITETVTKGLNHNVVMKDSGIVWIGKVPAKWRVENPKYHFTQRQERATKEMVQLTASQKYGVVTQAEYMELTGARVVVVQKDFDILKKVCAGDFIIHMRSFQGGLEYSMKTGSISSAYVMLIPKESIVEPRYYRWFFKSSAYIDALSSTSNLVRDGQAMRWANFIQLPITIPPADEQTQIADFLDAKCAEINSIIASKKAQLETLDAYKKSLIFEYVTGKKEVPETVTVVSINPHVPLLAMVVDMLKKPRGEVVDQKLLYLCDVYLGLGLSTQYYRWDYGPFDKQLYSYIDTLVSNGWYKVNIQNKAKVLVKAENHAEALEMYGNQLAQNKSDIEKLVQYFGEMRVSEIERFATLFAVWNDFIIDGIPAPSDYQIIDDVLTNWRPTKGRFSRDTWQNTLLKMKRDGIIPKGLGLHTLPKPEGGKSDA